LFENFNYRPKTGKCKYTKEVDEKALLTNNEIVAVIIPVIKKAHQLFVPK
jgi:hypothetical protein